MAADESQGSIRQDHVMVIDQEIGSLYVKLLITEQRRFAQTVDVLLPEA
jgi:hypothetical protein